LVFRFLKRGLETEPREKGKNTREKGVDVGYRITNVGRRGGIVGGVHIQIESKLEGNRYG